MADAQRPYTLQQRYEQLAQHRTSYLNRARSCAALTIPAMLPPDGHSPTAPLPTPWQSLGARGVNHLSSKLLLALFQPNAPFFKLGIDELLLEKLTKQPELKAEVDEGLARVERSVMGEIETTAVRVGVFEALKHLLVSGNVCVFMNPKGGLRIFRLDRYVAKRDPMGNLLETIIREDISPMELSDSGQAALTRSGWQPKSANETEDTVQVYTRVYRRDQKFTTYQEVNGTFIEGSAGQYPLDACPWLVLRWTEVDNEDYGRGFVEEYFGDLRSLEGLTRAIVQGSAAASKVLFLVRPNSTTKHKVLSESESGDVREGNAEDVTCLQMDKYADFRVAFETRNEIKQSLSLAFLLNSAIQRSGERVTAEEIRYMAEELESSLGGVYSALSQTLQRPMVSRLLAQMQTQGKLPQLPKGVVKVQITTGMEALGRNSDLNKLKAFVADLAQFGGPEVLKTYMDISNLITRLGTGYSIDTKGLVLSAEQVAQNQQAEAQAAMAQQLGPNMVNQAGGLMKQAAEQGGS